MIPILQNFFQYYDLDGSPLQNGAISFGLPYQNSETTPTPVYWDQALTQPAAQPIRTLNGFVVNDGKQANLYCATNYSMIVRNKKQQIVSSFLNSNDNGMGGLMATLNALIQVYTDMTYDLQMQAFTHFTTTGGSGVFIVNVNPFFGPTPITPLTSYSEGLRLNLTFNADGTGSDQLNVNSLGNIPIKQYASDGTLIAPYIKAGLNSDVFYNGSVFILLDTLPSVNGPEIGKCTFFASTAIPTNYLKADGSVVPNGIGTVQGITANFSALYAVVGSTYGSAGQLPDLRGEFIRGFDNGRGQDPSRVFGSTQADLFASHNHTLPCNIGVGNYSSGGDSPMTSSTLAAGVGDGNSGGSETRPKNVALLACIKYQ